MAEHRTRLYRNDENGSLKAAALRAAVDLRRDKAPSPTWDDVVGTAELFYEWLREH